jgi:O-6-methylguanine DNA methyltransferase
LHRLRARKTSNTSLYQGVCWTGTPGTSREECLAWLERRLAVARVIEGEEVEPLRQAMDQLRRYFAGERIQFSCPLDLRGTPFQVAVWQELYCISYGSTRIYSQIANSIGYPKAVRAVGAANGANPVAVIVPCHRVIGRNGTMTGYPQRTKYHSKRLATILPELASLFELAA